MRRRETARMNADGCRACPLDGGVQGGAMGGGGSGGSVGGGLQVGQFGGMGGGGHRLPLCPPSGVSARARVGARVRVTELVEPVLVL